MPRNMSVELMHLLGEDLVQIMDTLYQSGKQLHDYKFTGNKIGISIVIHLADQPCSPHARFSSGRSPAKQQRDSERYKRWSSGTNMSTPNVVSCSGIGSSENIASLTDQHDLILCSTQAGVQCDKSKQYGTDTVHKLICQEMMTVILHVTWCHNKRQCGI